ncbi:hypothetical protein Tco_1123221 [Tanacetum coccineum]|uniref:Uncharacterized protein n=1 Tax=Tanacetum coccineum TaxID=301880 RepID=A0ABQ5J2R5_9ASTR
MAKPILNKVQEQNLADPRGIAENVLNKDEGKSRAGTLIDILVFVRSFSIITGFNIIDGDDITKDVMLGMEFCKKYASCQMIMKKFAHGDECEKIDDE